MFFKGEDLDVRDCSSLCFAKSQFLFTDSSESAQYLHILLSRQVTITTSSESTTCALIIRSLARGESVFEFSIGSKI